jgi:RNA polymerase sigma-70 factor (ECF subfamily)
MLGSASEADDAVQEAWLRFSRAGADEVENLGGWLTTIVARVSLNMLQSRRLRREDPIDAGTGDSVAGGTDPEQEAVLADSVGLALLVVLDTLTPAERLAFVLHDMFAMPFDEIAPIVDRSPAAARQLASRARRRVQQADARPGAEAARQREIVGATAAAATFSGRAKGARLALIDGVPGIMWAHRGQVRVVFDFVIMGRKIVAIEMIADPEHLAQLEIVPAEFGEPAARGHAGADEGTALARTTLE